MKTGVLGGTFNPIHNGHISLATQLVQSGRLNRVLFVVSANPPHKSEEMPSAEHRLEMVRLALQQSDSLIPCDLELKRAGKSYTVHTMQELHLLYPKDELFFITGADMFADIPNWFMPEKLLREENIIVVDREKSFTSPQFIKRKQYIQRKFSPKSVTFYGIETPAVSSSNIRRNPAMYTDAIPPLVLDYMKRNQLYEG